MTPDTAWAMRESALLALSKETTPRSDDADLPAVTALISRHGFALVDGTLRAGASDGAGVLPILGEIVSRGQWMALARDFTALLDDPSIDRVVLAIDSPGGTVAGTSEFADLVFYARATKPITAFVAGVGASAAYWIASAANDVVITDTAEVGSIGVTATWLDFTGMDRSMGVERVTIVSSQSPRKNLPPSEASGRQLLQQRVDQIAEVFLTKVARNRGVSTATVKDRYGAGDLLVGRAAVQAGLADRIGTFDTAVRPDSAARELQRITAIRAITPPGLEVAADAAIRDGLTPGQAARAILGAQQRANIGRSLGSPAQAAGGAWTKTIGRLGGGRPADQ